MNFKQYLESIGAKVGDKLEFVGYTYNLHRHWNFHDKSKCRYKDFYVGEDGYMHCDYEPVKGKHLNHKLSTNWGFEFKVVDTSFKKYFEDNGFSEGDELEFVGYSTDEHAENDCWRFDECNFKYSVRDNVLVIHLDGYTPYLRITNNYGYIFKRKLSQATKDKIAALRVAIETLEEEIKTLEK